MKEVEIIHKDFSAAVPKEKMLTQLYPGAFLTTGKCIRIGNTFYTGKKSREICSFVAGIIAKQMEYVLTVELSWSVV